MTGWRSKAAAGVVGALLLTLPQDEGGVKGGFSYPYVDIAGVKTVCYGHVSKKIENRAYTQAECEKLLEADIIKHYNRVTSCIPMEIPESMLVAFTSFDFNTGGFCDSRARRELLAKRFKESCDALAHGPTGRPAWSYINKTQFVEGLYQRRLRERKECLRDLK